MKKKNIVIIVIVISIAALVLGFILSCRYQPHKGYAGSSQKEIYYCPMHPGYTSDKPGDCTICGMKLVKKEVAQEIEKKAQSPGKILYYRNPMNPEVTSPVPAKDQMGMDYIPVYEEEKETESTGIHISYERQQFIGVKKEAVQKRKLVKEINTVGRIAYDPELYVAQQEYIEALKVQENTKDSNLTLIKEQMKSLAEAAKRKLLLLGMSKAQIEELSPGSKADSSLYLPIEEDIVWVYMTIYEYEVGLVKVGQIIEIDSVAYPGDVFEGEVVSITPVLDPNTRSINVRAKIKNIENKLKPEMFVNAKIKVEMGEKLAVPEEAVMDTGERRIVFIAQPEGHFVSRKVTLGHKAGGYYEVLDGLDEGDLVVTSGNFFIDSESRLKAAISGESHKHGQ
ncbi:MAG: efflux RND transporter periplasmic adaptor subunit [Candidatus Omnitrophota bacterium]|nr:efflux RND transporter periplasmic adaptor subunit [Candidatus Omnitrophota bacterium]